MLQSTRQQGAIKFTSALTALCFNLFCPPLINVSICPSTPPSILYAPISHVDNILLTFYLSHLLCGQGPQNYLHYQYCQFLCDGIWNAVITSVFSVLSSLFLLHGKKRCSYPWNYKNQNTGSIPPLQQWAMSLFCVNELKIQVCVCVLWVGMLGQVGVHLQYVHTLKICHFSL